MKRLALVVVVAAMVAVGGALWLAPWSGADPYRVFRQTTEQEIPGTFGYVLAPPEGEASADPSTAYTALPGAGDGRDVAVTLATLRNDGDGRIWETSWIYFTHDLCYFTSKGDIVSPGRIGRADACTKRNLHVQVVDAESGEMVAAFPAFDLARDWLPEREGTPDQAGATRFH